MPSNLSWSILLIEKSKDLQSLIHLSINLSIDATVHRVLSVSDAIEIIPSSLPDIILLGLENDGLESLVELQEQPIIRTIPVVVMTSRLRQSDHLKIQASGVVKAILPYSFEPVHLEAILQELS